MAPTLPVYEPDAATTALYLTLAENKLAMDRAKRSDEAITAAIIDLTYGRSKYTTEHVTAGRRLTVTQIPATTTRRAKKDARARVTHQRPDLVPHVISEITPSRLSRATFITSRQWDHLTAAFSDTLAPSGPLTKHTVWGAWDLRAQARQFLTDARKDDTALRNELDERLRATGLLDTVGKFIHAVPGGGSFRVGTNAVTHRLNTAALAEMDPDLYDAVTDTVDVPAKYNMQVKELDQKAQNNEGE